LRDAQRLQTLERKGDVGPGRLDDPFPTVAAIFRELEEIVEGDDLLGGGDVVNEIGQLGLCLIRVVETQEEEDLVVFEEPTEDIALDVRQIR
jgi:hypothetical protein